MEQNNARILFMGTPSISSKVLRSLISNNYNIVGVVSQPDRPIGRKKIIEKTPTKLVAEEFNIPCYQPVKIRLDYEFVKELKPDVIITFAYGQIVPQGLLDIPTIGCINLHGSLLPKLRGAAPIQYSLINNEKITGVTLMKMIKEMDAGEMYDKEEVEIDELDNSNSLFDKIAVAAEKLILRALPKYINHELIGVPQNEDEVTFARMIKPEQEKLDLNMSYKDFIGWVKGLSLEPGGYVFLNDVKFKILMAKYHSGEVSGQIGEIVNADKKGLIIQLSDGQVELLQVQLSGKKMMDGKSFCNGMRDLKGQILK